MNTLFLLPIFIVAVYLGLFIPKLSLDWIGITSHRSIVTHSMLLPMVLLLVKSNITKAVVAGLCVGMSIYLAMDMVSAIRGYATITIPLLTQFSFSGWKSLVWLGLNSALGLYMAARVTSFHRLIVPGSFVCAAIAYAFYFHYSLVVLLPCLVVMVFCYRKPLL
ncbi:hypothetical protein KP803_10605 [Vibrio sp. ZSDE26]|uniref:Uncharacterized protein n=1 Tax=Vibrio amylolyticus TaxID=2847292 RepID=A0A9X2BLA8_9VIBR|nr:hypothetical protein [Vibrio amylolyticus]MCK6263723.1 hypothetical protein [Vibrio amylolyticus]